MFQAVERDEDQFPEIREEGDESNGEVDEIVNVFGSDGFRWEEITGFP